MFRKEAWARVLHLRVVSLYMRVKATRLGEITKGVNINEEEKKINEQSQRHQQCEDRDTPTLRSQGEEEEPGKPSHTHLHM